VRTQGGAGWSPGAQHAQQLEGWLVHIPGLKVVFPSTPEDVRGLLWSAIYDDNPVVFFEHRTLYPIKGDVPDELEPIPLGKARVHREGTDVTVVATGRLVHESLKAAEEAEKEGISVEVVDPRTLLPLDEEALIASVKKTTRCVTAHEAITRGDKDCPASTQKARLVLHPTPFRSQRTNRSRANQRGATPNDQ